VGVVLCQSFGKGYDLLRLGNGRFLSGRACLFSAPSGLRAPAELEVLLGKGVFGLNRYIQATSCVSLRVRASTTGNCGWAMVFARPTSRIFRWPSGVITKVPRLDVAVEDPVLVCRCQPVAQLCSEVDTIRLTQGTARQHVVERCAGNGGATPWATASSRVWARTPIMRRLGLGAMASREIAFVTAPGRLAM